MVTIVRTLQFGNICSYVAKVIGSQVKWKIFILNSFTDILDIKARGICRDGPTKHYAGMH